MSQGFWIRYERGYTSHEKWERLSDAAFRLMHRLKDHADGTGKPFLPEDLVLRKAGAGSKPSSKREAQKLIRELLECGQGFTPAKSGLIELAPGGYLIHDFWKYAPPGAREVQGAPPPSAPQSAPVSNPAASTGTPSARAAAASKAGKASAAARLASNGTAQPGRTSPERTPNDSPERSPNGARTSSNGAPERPRTHGDLAHQGSSEDQTDYGSRDPKESLGSQDFTGGGASERSENPSEITERINPTNFDQAIAIEIKRRSEFVIERPYDADFLRPKDWPEVKQVLAAWVRRFNCPSPRLGSLPGDKGLLALLERFREGYSPAELCAAVEATRGDSWFEKERPDLSALTAGNVRRLVALARPASGESKRSDVERTFAAIEAERKGSRPAEHRGPVNVRDLANELESKLK